VKYSQIKNREDAILSLYIDILCLLTYALLTAAVNTKAYMQNMLLIHVISGFIFVEQQF